jgi:peptide/nickel transport system permease protein
MEISAEVEKPSEIDTIPEMEASTASEITADEQLSSEDEMSKKSIPWWGEFVGWMTAFYRGDLGVSISPGSSTPVIEILKITLPRTLLLLIPGTVGGFLLGMWLGKIVAWRPRGWTEFATTLGGTAFYTSFAPWLAFVMISIFGLYLDWFPPEKLIDPKKWYSVDISLNEVINRILITIVAAGLAYVIVVWLTHHLTYRKSVRWRLIGGTIIIVIAAIPWILTGLWPLALDLMNHLVLPLATLILLSFGETMLIMKTTMTEAVVAQHVTTARAKGLPDVRVRDRHAARVAILPVLTRFIVHLPFIIIGSFVVEHFFYWDGMGQELVRAANENDLPVLLGVLSVVAIGILVAHTVLDILTTLLDPRLRKFREAKTTGEVV